MTAPPISAIICTHNRDKYLGLAIDSALAQDCPAFEVLVVDNGCTDQTREVVTARLTDSRLRYICEPVLGLSVARNTGAREAQGSILAYLDDDAIASPQWLRVLHQAFHAKEHLAIAGGKVTLIWPEGVTPPAWLSPDLAVNLGAYDLGAQPVSIQTAGLSPRGLNYGIRRSFLEQVGGFNPQLGRVGKNLLSNEELHMTQLALNAGWQVAYLPEAQVAHHVAPERTRPGWFLHRSWWQGISVCYQEQMAGQSPWAQLTKGGERAARGLYKTIKFFPNPALRFENLVYAYGQISYLGMVLRGLVLPSREAS